MKKTKIVCTLGPASGQEEVLASMMDHGMDVARLNFAHGTYETYQQQINMVRKVSREKNRYVGVLIDIKGPEIRLGALETDAITVKKGETIILTTEEVEGNHTRISVNHKGFASDVSIGAKVLIDDGSLELHVVDIAGANVTCEIKNDGIIKPRKGVNLPGVVVSLPGVTERDLEHILFGIQHNIDIIAMSFVRKASDVVEVKEFLRKQQASHIQVISKIENQEGIDNFDDILQVSDGIMVARGDLGVEIPMQEVPILQKMMIKKCNLAGKPVITATQMLDSMQQNPRPTRAEASDVANAIFDGTDAIMLSGETAAGKYPIESVSMMTEIAQETEKHFVFDHTYKTKANVTECIGEAAVNIAGHLNAKAIVVPTETGYTARMIAKLRPITPVIAYSRDVHTLRSLSLTYGVTPLLGIPHTTTDELLLDVVKCSKKADLVKEQDVIVVTGGFCVGETGATNFLKVDTVD